MIYHNRNAFRAPSVNLPDQLFAAPWLWGGALMYALVLFVALATAPWSRLNDGRLQSVFFGTCVTLMLLWSLHAGIRPGLHLHFLGVTALTLMFGWQFAVIGASLVTLGVTLNGGAGWSAYPFNVLLMGAVPIGVTWAAYRLARRYLPAHFFVFVFVNAFLAAALGLAAGGAAAGALLIGAGPYDAGQVAAQLTALILLLFPEALMNGMAITLMISYRPHWVVTFEDQRYLQGK